MEEKANELSERFLAYAAEIVKLVMKLRRTSVGREIGGQLLRSGTSTGANYEEGCGAQSRADFIHKLQIVFKELRESLFWLKLIRKSELLKDDSIEWLIKETKELSSIIAKSLITAKRGK